MSDLPKVPLPEGLLVELNYNIKVKRDYRQAWFD